MGTEQLYFASSATKCTIQSIVYAKIHCVCRFFMQTPIEQLVKKNRIT